MSANPKKVGQTDRNRLITETQSGRYICCSGILVSETIYLFVTIYRSLVLKIKSKGAKIRNRYNQVPLLTKDTNGKVTNSQLDTTNESQEVSQS